MILSEENCGSDSIALPAKHTAFSISYEGRKICSFRIGTGAWFWNKSSDVRFVYGFILHSDDMLPRVIKSIESMLFLSGSRSMLVCMDQALEKKVLAALGLYLIGKSENLPRLEVKDDLGSLGNRMRTVVRKHLPALASAAYNAMNAINPPRHHLEGSLGGVRTRAEFIGPGFSARFYAFSFLENGRVVAKGRAEKPEFSITLSKHPGAAGSLSIPAYVRSIVQLPQSFEEYMKGFKWTTRSDISKMQRNGLCAKTSEDPVDFALFYHSMYLPTVLSRHNEHSIILSYDDLRIFFDAGSILFIMRNDIPIGGAVVTPSPGNRLLMKCLGVLDGDHSNTIDGANAAMLYFSIHHAFEKKTRLVDFGLNSPFQDDGVVRFKKKWRATEVIDKDCEWLVVRFHDDKARSRFLDSKKPYLCGELPLFDTSTGMIVP